MNVCVIDIGSNTIKATIFSISKNRTKKTLSFKGHKAKLGLYKAHTEDGVYLSGEGILVLCESVSDLISFAEKHNCDSVYAFATASLRGLLNAQEILDLLFEKYSLKVEILSGKDEALYSLKGLLSDEDTYNVKSGVMIDMGGGSTEIVYFDSGKTPKIVSLPFGCLNLYEEYVKDTIPTDEEILKIENHVQKELKNCTFIKGINEPVFLIGGSARAVLKIVKTCVNRDKLRSDSGDFTLVIDKMREEDFFNNAEKLIPGRTTTVTTGAVAYRTILNFIAPSSVTVSLSGVREGYLEKILP
ncbi:MAG: hypothetical protein E7582_02600 [Ruminococcaceae bacterium]|nr:hypothetical protein [Oscillospiraceae bacterium]